MPYIAPEVVAEAKKIDLLAYLKNYEPNELVRFSDNTYTTKTHDSLKISNGLWNWFSKGIGGKTALEYLIKVKGYTFTQAVETIVGKAKIQPPITYEDEEKRRADKLILPEKSSTDDKAIAYLKSRGIDEVIIEECIEKRIYLSRR